MDENYYFLYVKECLCCSEYYNEYTKYDELWINTKFEKYEKEMTKIMNKLPYFCRIYKCADSIVNNINSLECGCHYEDIVIYRGKELFIDNIIEDKYIHYIFVEYLDNDINKLEFLSLDYCKEGKDLNNKLEYYKNLKSRNNIEVYDIGNFITSKTDYMLLIYQNNKFLRFAKYVDYLDFFSIYNMNKNVKDLYYKIHSKNKINYIQNKYKNKIYLNKNKNQFAIKIGLGYSTYIEYSLFEV